MTLYHQLRKDVFALILLGAAGLIFYYASYIPKFTEDGMVPRTDSASGCQYLSYGDTLMPRLTAGGRHMGCKQ